MSDVNQAREYGVSILPALGVTPGAEYWRVVEVRHLSPSENQGKHNVYVDAVDAAGKRVRGTYIDWDWAGRRSDEAPPAPTLMNKPDNEPAGNVPIEKGQHIRLWLFGLPSEAVDSLRADHGDELGPNGERWNTDGHHSFYVKFQRAVAQAGTTPGSGDQQPTGPATVPADVAADVVALRAEVNALKRWQQAVIAAFARMEGDL